MHVFNVITTFDIQKAGFNSITSFVGRDFTSPTLEKSRGALNLSIKPKEKKTFSWSDAEKDKPEDNELDLQTVSEERLNDSLEELTDEDYNDFAEIGIELFDYGLDRAFIWLGRNPSEADSVVKAKKDRLKIIAGRLFRKWGVKFSLEMLGIMLLLFYINARWTAAEKIDKGEKQTKSKNKEKKGGKVIQLKSVEKKADKMASKKEEPKKPAKKVSLM